MIRYHDNDKGDTREYPWEEFKTLSGAEEAVKRSGYTFDILNKKASQSGKLGEIHELFFL